MSLSMLRRFVLATATFAAVALAGPAWAQARYAFEQTRTILPKSVVPSHYRVALTLDPARDHFDGRVTIDVDVHETVAAIVLHAQYLQAHRVELRSGALRRGLRVSADRASLTWRLAPRDGRPIEPGRHRIEVDYRGRVNTSGSGLYRARHRVDGRQVSMLATQLEAVSARRVFPSFDEPVFRASFDVEVTAPRGLQVLSNQPTTELVSVGPNQRHRFATTPKMPVYLFAVAVGHFDVLEGWAAGVPLRIFTAPGKRELARYALAATQQVLPYFNDYFGTPYALPKLDQLAVPGTRDGAMEDWGLISYVEDMLLFDPERSRPEVERWIYDTIAHELAHQWFGNLVSVASWDEIWLNEAFATWMAKKTTERFKPEWQSQLAGRGWLDHTMERDAGHATRAIRSGPVSEASVFDVFDGITYSKGGAVLSMLEQWVGPEAFQRGLAAYMEERRMAPASAGDLWHHIGRAVGQPVAAVAASWTDQPGFPLIDVAARCEADRTVVTLRQSRFEMSGTAAAGTAEPLWQVPVRLARGDRVDTVLLDAPERRFDVGGCVDEPVIANAGGRGFYRVRYAEDGRARLVERFASLAPADRVTLLADSLALAQAGMQPLSRHFEWLAQLPRVTDASRASLYALAVAQFGLLEDALTGSPASASLREVARALFGPELARVGWQPSRDEDPEATRLRSRMIPLLARFDDPAVIAAARERFGAALAAGRSELPGSLRSAVIRAVGHHADRREFDALWSALETTNSQEDKHLYLAALTSTRDPASARRLLELSLADRLSPDLALALPGMVGDVPAHSAAAYGFTVARWKQLARRAGEGAFAERSELLPSAAGAFFGPADAQRLRDDQARLAGPTGAARAADVAARIEVRAALRERESHRLADALARWQPAP